MPQSSRTRRGSAYVEASAGMVAWKAVSKTATWGSCGRSARASRSAATAGAMCRGASSVSLASSSTTSSSTKTGSRNRAPPCTMRCTTAATPAGTTSSDSSLSVVPSASTADSFRLVEPALTSRTALIRPDPVADLRIVLAVLARVGARANPAIAHLLAQAAGTLGQPGNAVDHVHDEVEAVEVVEHDHVERRRRRAFFLVAADVQVPVIRAAVREPVDQPRITVVGEDDRPVWREQGVELLIREAVGMLGVRLQAHEVDDVDDAHLQLGQVLAKQRRCGERLEGGDVSAAAEHDVRSPFFIVGRPLPDADAAGAVHDRVLYCQVVQRRLLSRHDHVHVVAAAQAVVGDRQQRVRVGRQVDADHLGLLVDDVVDKARVLVREAVVVLAPDVRAE